ncbi:right-handed parallel beta-helix repeat-containing protein [Sphingobium sp. BYY-5]|uniref:right-handed parallel beta-helix repeat-containing protein n=1 Tax=Sphingobium sp. BYY-5 TaxID=2926400 RepID=UPI001FA7CB85|nr:right-handed parallel beta-helix repeat-containing protein [Sphingobium sp. BYY-5]MCI4588985.1 right-handed parallel beta-helix repeat-containing protein [Sphingobium sp. BYY-5]
MEILTRRRFMAATAASAAAMPQMLRAQISGQSRIIGQTFVGTRRPDGYGTGGGTAIIGQSDLLIRDCTFRDLGDGALLFQEPASNIVIEDCTIHNCYRFIKDWSLTHPDPPAPLTSFTIRRVQADALIRGFMRIIYGSSRGVIEDVVVRGNGHCNNDSVGFALDDSVNDVVYRRAQAHNFIEAKRDADRYWQGDGFTDERGNRNIRYYSCTATNNTDGGFDTKSAGVFLENCLAKGNKRNYRLWNSGHLKNCRSEDPIKRGGTGETAHFSFFGETGPTYVLDRPVVRAAAGNSAPVFFFQTTKPASIAIYDADIHAPDATLIVVDGPQPSIHWYPARPQQKIVVKQNR